MAHAAVVASDSEPEEETSKQTRPDQLNVHASPQPNPALPKRVWVDEDDEVNLLEVPRRKKLRKAGHEVVLSGEAYTDRVRSMLVERAAARGATGTWAELPKDGPVVVKANESDPSAKQRNVGDDSDGSDDDRGSDGGEDTYAEFEDPVDNGQGTDEDETLLADVRSLQRSNGQRRRQRSRALPAGIIRAKPAPHANGADISKCEASCVEFHPSGRLLMTAGLDKTARVFSIDGAENARVQAVHLHNFPIRSACFTRGGDGAVFTSRRRYLHSMDMESGTVTVVRSFGDREDRSWEHAVVDAPGRRIALAGQRGKVVLMSADSMRETGQLRVNGRIGAMAFGPAQREHEILTATEDGMIQLWDVRSMACVDRHIDEGAVHTSCLTVSGGHYATGSDSGVVNVYDSRALQRSEEDGGGETAQAQSLVSKARMGQPLKRFFNLRTPINHAVFSPDGQVLAFASHDKKGAVRLAHTGTMTVFRNWPSDRARVRRVCSLAFSPGGGYLAIGNDNGVVQMLRLLAYPAC